MANETRTDDGGINTVIQGMQTTVNQVARAQATADAIRGSLVWTGAASQAFKTSLDTWGEGVNAIGKALTDLETAMGIHLQATNTTEDDNTSHAKWHVG